MVKNLKEFTSKSTLNPCLQGVLVTSDRLVATDSFKLIEIQIVNQIKKSYVQELPKGIKTMHSVLNDKVYIDAKGSTIPISEINDPYPEYKAILAQLKTPRATVRLSASHLKAIAEAFMVDKKDMLNDYIDVELFDELKPVKFTRANITALLMPQIK